MIEKLPKERTHESHWCAATATWEIYPKAFACGMMGLWLMRSAIFDITANGLYSIASLCTRVQVVFLDNQTISSTAP